MVAHIPELRCWQPDPPGWAEDVRPYRRRVALGSPVSQLGLVPVRAHSHDFLCANCHHHGTIHHELLPMGGGWVLVPGRELYKVPGLRDSKEMSAEGREEVEGIDG